MPHRYGNFDRELLTPIDNVSKALATLTLAESEINSGIAFTVTQKFGPIVAGGTFNMLAKVPVTTFLHFHRMEVSAIGFTDVELFESPTHLDDGVAASPVNNNRIFATQFADEGTRVVVKGGVTVTDPGLLLTGLTFGTPALATSGVGRIGGTQAAQSKFVMQPGFDYLIRITNLEDATPISGRFTAFWFENGHGLSEFAKLKV